MSKNAADKTLLHVVLQGNATIFQWVCGWRKVIRALRPSAMWNPRRRWWSWPADTSAAMERSWCLTWTSGDMWDYSLSRLQWFWPPLNTKHLQFSVFMKWFACFGFFLQTQCDLHSLIQVMKAVFSEVPPLRMCLYPEECEYSFLFIPITLHMCRAASLLNPFVCPNFFKATDKQAVDLV